MHFPYLNRLFCVTSAGRPIYPNAASVYCFRLNKRYRSVIAFVLAYPATFFVLVYPVTSFVEPMLGLQCRIHIRAPAAPPFVGYMLTNGRQTVDATPPPRWRSQGRFDIPSISNKKSQNIMAIYKFMIKQQRSNNGGCRSAGALMWICHCVLQETGKLQDRLIRRRLHYDIACLIDKKNQPCIRVKQTVQAFHSTSLPHMESPDPLIRCYNAIH
jgi:hypothetical protein